MTASINRTGASFTGGFAFDVAVDELIFAQRFGDIDLGAFEDRFDAATLDPLFRFNGATFVDVHIVKIFDGLRFMFVGRNCRQRRCGGRCGRRTDG